MEENRQSSLFLVVFITVLGVFIFVAGVTIGGPDASGGVVFGGIALAAAAVILSRRNHPPKDPKSSEDTINKSPEI